MYTLVTAIAKPLNGDGRWTTVAIGSLSLSSLFSTYAKVLVTLSNPFLTKNVELDIDTIRNEHGGKGITFNNFLIANANNTLLTSDTLTVLSPKYAKYADAFKANYKITPIHSRAAADAQLPASEKRWLHVTRPNTDYTLFYKNCLAVVNGFIHLTDYDVNGVYIQDGNQSAIISKQNNIGFYSFQEVGELSFIPIKSEMLYKQVSLQPYKNKCFIDLGVDLSNKTIMVVLGGYLHVLDRKTFFRVSDSSFCIDIGNLPLLDRYYESRDYIDFSSLQLETTNRNKNQISIADFFSDKTITAYLTLPQSFFIIVDNNNIFVNKVPVHKTTLPDMFVSYIEPVYPLVVGVGKLANYWSVAEDGQYSITCQNSTRHNHLYNTIDVIKQVSVSNSNLSTNRAENSSAYYLEIGSDF